MDKEKEEALLKLSKMFNDIKPLDAVIFIPSSLGGFDIYRVSKVAAQVALAYEHNTNKLKQEDK